MAITKKVEQPKKIEPKKKDQVFGIQQIKFIEAYFDPKSPTYGDIKNSGKHAGFSDSYAENLFHLAPKWLSDFIGKRQKLVDRATERLEEFVDADIYEQAMGPFGPIFLDKKRTKPAMRRNSKVMAIVLDAAKFTTERLDSKNFGKTDHVETEHSGEIIHYHIPVRQTPEDWAGKALPPGK